MIWRQTPQLTALQYLMKRGAEKEEKPVARADTRSHRTADGVMLLRFPPLLGPPRSVKKKMRDSAFAAGVDRESVRHGAGLIGIDFDEHIATVIAAMRKISDELGLSKR